MESAVSSSVKCYTVIYSLAPAACDEGWSVFQDNCYKVLNNSDTHYDDIEVCRYDLSQNKPY